MPHLQLADGQRYLAEVQPQDLYVFIPDDETGATGKWVREDYFDNLDGMVWEQTMAALAPYQPDQMSGIFSGIKERIAERRERRTDRKEGRQEKRQQRAETGLFGGKLKGFISSLIPGGGGQQQFPTDGGTRGIDIDWSSTPPTFWEQNKTPILIGGAVLVAGGIYLATRNK